MKDLVTEITISSSPEKIWQVLTDFRNYSNWNPFIKAIEGVCEEGKKISIKVEVPGSSAMTISPEILKVIPQQELRWKGKLFITGLFDGEHIFQIRDNHDGTSLFIQKERFSGLLIPFCKTMIETHTRKGFELMNAALKETCEKSS